MSIAPILIAVSFKAFLVDDTLSTWLREVNRIPLPAGVEIAVFPSFLSIPGAVAAVSGRLSIGAQNLYPVDRGAFTGEVTGPQIREAGCQYVEIGHAERERLFGETEQDIADKLRAAQRNELIPLLCIGEPTQGSAADAAIWCGEKLTRVLGAAQYQGDIVVAYEPVWAIGAPAPAPAAHVRTVVEAIRRAVADAIPAGSQRVIYGGAAGVGVFSDLRDDIDGVFLGRYAHDPAAVRRIIEETSPAT